MKITFIETDEYEATLLVKTSVGEFISYADSVNIKSKDNFEKVEFFTLLSKNIVKDFDQRLSINKTNSGYFSYKISGKYIGENRILLDDCIFIVDSKIPGDIKVNDYVSFEFLRADAYIA